MSRPGPRPHCDERQVLEFVRVGRTNAQICAQLGIVDRTLTRWRLARPELNQAIIAERTRQRQAALAGHGTLGCYRRGCRCGPCTQFNTDRCSEGRRRRRARERGA